MESNVFTTFNLVAIASNNQGLLLDGSNTRIIAEKAASDVTSQTVAGKSNARVLKS